MVCRIRRYRGLTSGFRINDNVVTYMPFLLKIFFKNINEENGQVIYLVIRATPVFSAFKSKFSTAFDNAIPRHLKNFVTDYILKIFRSF